MDEILEILNSWDPVDLFPMAPKDEYIEEGKKIEEYIKNNMVTMEELANEINNIFKKSFGTDVYKKDVKACLKVAEKLLAMDGSDLKSGIEKWEPIKTINNSNLNIKSIIDDFDGLTVILENEDTESITIRWAEVESYCRSTEEVRYKFIGGEWQKIRKKFSDWSFFKVTNSPYIKWVKEQACGLMDEDRFIHYMIVSMDYVLDIVSRFEPDECYKNR